MSLDNLRDDIATKQKKDCLLLWHLLWYGYLLLL